LKPSSLLGEGAYGKVFLCEHNKTKATYALKCMEKAKVVKENMVDHVIYEVTLQEMCDHPCITHLFGFLQDSDTLKLVLEFVQGGDLWSFLSSRDKIDVPWARFYTACVTSAFSHLHELKIVYRDLKPENLLMDKDGYIKVADFGFAKRLLPPRDRTYSMVGTIEYLAPEILSKSGHSLTCDWWALGILIFEMVTGETPFIHDEDMVMCRMILKKDLEEQPMWWSVPEEARDIIKQLLVKDPNVRLGRGERGGMDVQRHSFLRSISFLDLEKKNIVAPFRPLIHDSLDTSYFSP